MPRLTTTATLTEVTDPRLDTTLAAYLDIDATLKRLMEEKKALRDDLKSMAFRAHKKGKVLATDTHVVRYVEATSASSIDLAKLLKHISAKVLKACTNPGTDYTYVGIFPKKEDGAAPAKTKSASKKR